MIAPIITRLGLLFTLCFALNLSATAQSIGPAQPILPVQSKASGFAAEIEKNSANRQACLDLGVEGAAFWQCLEPVYKEQDQLLNRIWAVLKRATEQLDTNKPSSNGTMYPALLAEQRAWLQYRDQACDFYQSFKARLWSRDLSEHCLFNTTKARLTTLNAYLEDIVRFSQ